MRVCVGTAKTSSPTENSARHTFQDRAYPYGRNARKRTKKSGIIYCLVTSHPQTGLGAKPDRFQGPQTPNSWSPAGEGEFEGIPAFPAQPPIPPQTRPILGLGRNRPNSSLEIWHPIFVLFGKSVNFPLAGRPISP
jgi:hypothetical protein